MVILSGESFGYLQLHKYFNEMAHMAKGDLLIIAGDDVKVITPSWDKELEFYRTKFKILKTQLYFPLPVGHDLYRIHHTMLRNTIQQ